VNHGGVFLHKAAILYRLGQSGSSAFGSCEDHNTPYIFVQSVDGEYVTAQLLFQAFGNFGLRIQTHGFYADSDVSIRK
jgi:hypothetical protein